MKQTIEVNNIDFREIKNGYKTRLYFLYDGRKRALQGGDIVTLKNKNNTLEVEIIKLSIYATFKDMYNEYFNIDFKNKYNSIEELLDETYKTYTEKEEETYACVVFEIKVV